jgi:bidirectional [NiFe] hydrogenase diaphorase subunit
VAKAVGDQKYVICNGDEGDPGAFMDRSVLESDPQRVIEGMAIAAYAVGASKGYVYVRAEYPLAVARLTNCLRDARRRGLLGNNICNTPFNFDVEIRLGAGAFVCGEETALIASIEGKRGSPSRGRRIRPSAACGASPRSSTTWKPSPTLRPSSQGRQVVRGMGTEKSKGTKVFALTGKITNTGLVEVPMGMTLREIRSSKASAAAFPTATPSRPCRPAAPPAAAFPNEHARSSRQLRVADRWDR